MDKTLDGKLAEIHANPDSRAFILADAKDADMAFGIAAPGRSPEHADGEFRTLGEYRDHIRDNVRQGLLDIMLMSVSTNEVLTIRERIFDGSPVTPAVRANDTTDIHVARGSAFPNQPSRPFRTALLDHAMCGRLSCDDAERHVGANLGLYSVTFNNDAERDARTLEAYREFRIDAERKGFRHFLEVFDPNAPVHPVPDEKIGAFLNDLIVRTLAGVASPGRPLFLKMPYHGPQFMEELAAYDPHLVPGILGGSAGTTYDAFKLLDDARAHGAKAALFGRKINNSEHQLSFIQFLRWIADGEVSAEAAVPAYHGVLQGLGIRPHRPLADDMVLTNQAVGYAGTSTTVTVPARAPRPTAETAPRPQAAQPAPAEGNGDGAAWPTLDSGLPDFARMTPAQRLAYHRDRINRTIG